MKSKVIELVVDQDMCTGCGLCTQVCPTEALKMNLKKGFLIPEQNLSCDESGECITVCPFDPDPLQEVKDEDVLSEQAFPKDEMISMHPSIGRYRGLYAGYSNEFRSTSSSGGMMTEITQSLLNRHIVDHVINVQSNGDRYEYNIQSRDQQITIGSTTKYYPVTLADIWHKIEQLSPNTIAIVGVGCFLKAVRKMQHKQPHLKERIPFLIGLVCGGLKSTDFTEYLASKAGFLHDGFTNPEYRIKNLESTAYDYSFQASDKLYPDEKKTTRMKDVGDMWSPGQFKANACDFCSDVFTELADITMGDSWMAPYALDGHGCNIIITRSKLAEDLMKMLYDNDRITVDIITEEQMLKSQRGGINHKQLGLQSRVERRALTGKTTQPLRERHLEEVSESFKMVQFHRMSAREISTKLWSKKFKYFQNFDAAFSPVLRVLQKATKKYHEER